MRHLICVLIFSVYLAGCDRGIDDNSRRNEKWAWLVDSNGQGQWVPVASEQGTVTGTYTLFYSTGEVYETGYIEDGIKIDSVLVYDKSGDSLRYIIYESDSVYRSYYIHNGPYSETFQTGEIKLEGTVKNNLQDGRWKQYDQNGTLIWECNLFDQTGWELNYFDSGMRKDCTHYVNGKQTGVLHVWYENGNLKQVTYWRNNVQDSILTVNYRIVRLNSGLMEKSRVSVFM
jgi:antitoxin component YwqK of YwqJK toxin-antitoxin module